jgi:hypothetical protein
MKRIPKKLTLLDIIATLIDWVFVVLALILTYNYSSPIACNPRDYY